MVQAGKDYLKGTSDHNIESNLFYPQQAKNANDSGGNSAFGHPVEEAKLKFAQEIVQHYIMDECGQEKYFECVDALTCP